MSLPYLGEVRLFSFGFAPKGCVFCAGQILPIDQNTALFAVLGTTYGGNGQTTFALPNLQGNTILSSGQGPGLSNYILGQAAGSASVTLNPQGMPSHTHSATCTNTPASLKTNPTGSPVGQVWAADAAGVTEEYAPAASLLPMSPAAIGNTGGSQAHENRSPFLVLNYCIALQGVFPSRN